MLIAFAELNAFSPSCYQREKPKLTLQFTPKVHFNSTPHKYKCTPCMNTFALLISAIASGALTDNHLVAIWKSYDAQ